MAQGFSPRGFAESFTPRAPQTMNPLVMLWQALQADPTGASGMASPVAGPALLGALFKDPKLAGMFRSIMQAPRFTAGGTTAKAQGGDLGLAFWQHLINEMMLRGGINPETMGPNIANSVVGQTFGKGGILPFSGAAHKVPRQAMSSEALLAALLSGVVP